MRCGGKAPDRPQDAARVGRGGRISHGRAECNAPLIKKKKNNNNKKKKSSAIALVRESHRIVALEAEEKPKFLPAVRPHVVNEKKKKANASKQTSTHDRLDALRETLDLSHSLNRARTADATADAAAAAAAVARKLYTVYAHAKRQDEREKKEASANGKARIFAGGL
jgi:hypothetical protein